MVFSFAFPVKVCWQYPRPPTLSEPKSTICVNREYIIPIQGFCPDSHFMFPTKKNNTKLDRAIPLVTDPPLANYTPLEHP